MNNFTESEIETFSISELKQLGFSYIPGPSIAPDVEATQALLVAEPSAAYGVSEKRATFGREAKIDESRICILYRIGNQR